MQGTKRPPIVAIMLYEAHRLDQHPSTPNSCQFWLVLGNICRWPAFRTITAWKDVQVKARWDGGVPTMTPDNVAPLPVHSLTSETNLESKYTSWSNCWASLSFQGLLSSVTTLDDFLIQSNHLWSVYSTFTPSKPTHPFNDKWACWAISPVVPLFRDWEGNVVGNEVCNHRGLAFLTFRMWIPSMTRNETRSTRAN